jgi:putative SOS response-associated peptidase YedK
MCGRFVSSSTPEKIAAYFGASFETEPLGENYNVAPTSDILGIVQTGDGEDAHREVQAFHWGLVPFWAKDTKVGSRMINARCETLIEKPVFRKLLGSRRVIVPMDGFYEWQVVPGQKRKRPMFVHRRDGEPLSVAGLWTTWRDKDAGPDAPWLHSCTIITTSANQMMMPVHDRMPVILPERHWAAWLDPSFQDVEALQAMLVPAPDELLTMHAVSTDVNNVRNTGEHLIDPVELDELAEPGGAAPARQLQLPD